MAPLVLVPIRPVSLALVGDLVKPLERTFGGGVRVAQGLCLDPVPAYDAGRNQYDSSELIRLLLAMTARREGRVLGIASVDLFVPVLTYVFGEAQLDGRAAVVSSFRLDETIYGLQDDPVLLRDRLLKEAVHEVGHTLGLVHCRDYACVMHSSTSVEEIDVKTAVLCRTCEAMIARA